MEHLPDTTNKASIIDGLVATNFVLSNENSELKSEITKLSSSLKQATDHIKWLAEQDKLSRQKLFGKQSEQTESLQGELFDEGLEEDTPADEIETETISYERKKTKKKGRLLDTSSLPREQIIYDLAEDEKQCSCGCELTKIGEDVSEQVDYVPASLKVIEHVKVKYSCKKCSIIKSGPKPEQALGKCMATERFVADVIIKKYDHHLPQYRQSVILAQEGATIPDNTLGNWVMKAAEVLSPLGDALWQQLEHTNLLQADETPVKILKPDKKGFLWGYHSYQSDNRFVIFEFNLSRGSDVPNNRLNNYKGILQTDAYGGYNTLRAREDVIDIGCMDHGRRKFVETIKVCNNNDTGVAGKILKLINKLYKIEKAAKNMSYDERYTLRQAKAKPILNDIYNIFTKASPFPKSLLGKAITYLSNNWPELTKYVEHGAAELSNCWMENLIRPLALGKKNWMFVGNEVSANKAALLYGLIQTCKMNNINPRDYLIYVIKQTHKIRRNEIDPVSLLPQFIDKALLA